MVVIIIKLNYGDCRLSRGLNRLTNRETRRSIGEETEDAEESKREEWEVYSKNKHNNIIVFIASVLLTGFLLWFKSI